MSEVEPSAAVQPALAIEPVQGAAAECWCCGRSFPDEQLVRLGNHPEVMVCLACAQFLHQRARQLEDAAAPSVAGRARDGLRRARRLVMARGWRRRPVAGRPLHWLGRRLP